MVRPSSSRFRARSSWLMWMSRSAASPISPTNSRVVSRSMFSSWRMESVSRRMEARGLQLMGGVGHKPPPLLLGGLEPSGELVELVGQLAQLVLAVQGDPVGVLSLPHPADARQEHAHPAGEHPGKGGKEGQHRQADHQRDQPQVVLNLVQQDSLTAVGLIKTDRPHHGVSGHNGGGRPAGKDPGLILAGKGVAAPQGGHHLPGQGVFPHLGVLSRVVEDQPGLVGDEDPLNIQVLQGGDGLLHRLGGQLVGGGQGVGHQGRLVLQGGLLAPEHQILGGDQRVGVQEDQQGRDDGGVPDGQAGLEGPPHLGLVFLSCHVRIP